MFALSRAFGETDEGELNTMPPLRTGLLSFGLVSIPVQLHSVTLPLDVAETPHSNLPEDLDVKLAG